MSELNLAAAHEAVAAAIPERECVVWRDRRLTWAEMNDRTRRLANLFADHGLGCHGDPAAVPGWESVQDHLAIYLTNGNEYLEAMFGAFKARLAPFNVNYRYRATELAYLLGDARSRAVVYHARYASTLADVLPELDPPPVLLLQVADESSHPLLPGALDYEAAMAASSGQMPDAATDWSADDLYILYTGGTTGMPKGTLWRQADFLAGCLGISGSIDDLVAAASGRSLRVLPAPPLMHGAAHWNAISGWLAGAAVVFQDHPERLDPADVLATCQRERVSSLLIVGDAFARPLLDEVRRAHAAGNPYDLSSLRFLLTGGAVLSPALKAEWGARVPHLRVVDILGSSESGRQGVASGTATTFARSPSAVVLTEDRTRLLDPGDEEIGWLATAGRVPRGYLGDRAKSEATFPEIEGTRYAVAGDRARLAADGTIELYGRDSVTINTGGEKVFAEEVEQALKHHPAVYDALVVGRPSERWGSEVTAVVQLRDGAEPSPETDEELRIETGRYLAGYKLPKAFVYVDHIERSPSGKPDYRWARETATAFLDR